MINLQTHKENTLDLKVGQRFIDRDFTYIYEVVEKESVGCLAKVIGSTHDFLFAAEVVNVIDCYGPNPSKML